MELIHGVYEALINQAIQDKLDLINPADTLVAKESIDSSSSNEWLAKYLAGTVSVVLQEKFKSDKREKTISEQVECVNRILQYIEQEWDYNLDDDLITDTDQFLRGIYNKVGYSDAQIIAKSRIHPMSGYRTSSLFT